MTDLIRETDKDGREPARPDGAPLLRQAARLAIGLSALPLLGLGVFMSRARKPAIDVAKPDAIRPAISAGGTPPKPPAPDADPPPNRDDVEAALRKLTDATLPKTPPRGRPERTKP